MSQQKKQLRARFRQACYQRDRYCCVMCGFASTPDKVEDELDAHHITDRNDMPNGGCVKENGISLCSGCHERAEIFHSTGVPYPGYAPEDLYKAIGSSYDMAYKASVEG
jgi:hypothetical protein